MAPRGSFSTRALAESCADLRQLLEQRARLKGMVKTMGQNTQPEKQSLTLQKPVLVCHPLLTISITLVLIHRGPAASSSGQLRRRPLQRTVQCTAPETADARVTLSETLFIAIQHGASVNGNAVLRQGHWHKRCWAEFKKDSNREAVAKT